MPQSKIDFSSFCQKIPLESVKGNYRIKTISNPNELGEILKLRHRVFHTEYGMPATEHGYDVDEYDFLCDHLVIEDLEKKQLVGTYRLLCTLFTNRFYSQEEFEFDGLFELPGEKLELGRACVHPDYREGGLLIQLLWRGLAEYLKKVNAQYLFGCSSVKVTDENQMSQILGWLKEKDKISEKILARPKAKYQFDGPVFPIKPTDESQVLQWLPSLFNSYLRAGSKICSEPALDRDFNCTDLMTVLKMDELNPAFVKRFTSQAL